MLLLLPPNRPHAKASRWGRNAAQFFARNSIGHEAPCQVRCVKSRPGLPGLGRKGPLALFFGELIRR